MVARDEGPPVYLPLNIKCVTERGAVEIHGDQAMARRCFIAAIRPKPEKKVEKAKEKVEEQEGLIPSK